MDDIVPLRVDAARFREDFEALACIGATDDGGVHRPSLSPQHLAARAWFRQRAAQAGLEVTVDPAGNHSAVLRFPGAVKTLLLGSHLDSVPYGGRFDGPLGVLAALEALRTVREAGVRLPVNLEAIDFTDEEGTILGFLGSGAVAGCLSREVLRQPPGGRAALEAALARAGLHEDTLLDARRDPNTLAGYLELHIEQGPRLEKADVPIGVVTRIIGSRCLRIVFEGAANHAGTTPMTARSDAGVGAGAFVVSVRRTVVEHFPDSVANVGRIAFEPGVSNIIPGRASLLLEFRSLDRETLDDLQAALLEEARRIADREGLSITWQTVSAKEPAAMHPGAQAAITEAAEALGLKTVFLTSGAGHDAHPMAQVTPSGMIFVPSVGGISHQSAEFTHWEHCVQGANVLLGAALAMAGSSQAWDRG